MSAIACVHVAGLGAVSPAGSGVGKFWQALFAQPAEPSRAVVPGLPADGKSLRHGYAVSAPPQADAQRFEQLARAAIGEALLDAQARGHSLQGARIGLAIGTAAGDAEVAERQRLNGQAARFALCNPYRAANELAANLPLAIEGPAFAVANACSAGLYALAHAADLINQGEADAMIVVGVELLSRVTQAGFQKMTALDPDRCRPFDALRHGTVLGEGAAALVLVSDALRTSAVSSDTYCRLTGTGLSCDAHHPTAPQPDGRDIRAAVDRAMAQAGVSAAQIALVVPHGTGTPMNDRIEGDMLASVAGAHTTEWSVMPIKSHIGHGAGASGCFSVLAAALALAAREVPPTLHIRHPDAAVPLRFSEQTTALPACLPLRALVNAYGFGGNNISIVLEASAHG
jgi:3-oxoacyl-[acyl-carrier-protein] synthase II